MEITQHARYTCTFCGKNAVKRTSVGIWNCKSCDKTVAGGAWTVSYVPHTNCAPPHKELQIANTRTAPPPLPPQDRPSVVSASSLRCKFLNLGNSKGNGDRFREGGIHESGSSIFFTWEFCGFCAARIFLNMNDGLCHAMLPDSKARIPPPNGRFSWRLQHCGGMRWSCDNDEMIQRICHRQARPKLQIE